MEAMGSGALVLVDRMYVPRPSPLVDGAHIVYYGKHAHVHAHARVTMSFVLPFFCVDISFWFIQTHFSTPIFPIRLIDTTADVIQISFLYIDNQNRTDLFAKLDFYLSQTQLARRVAVAGYLHCMKFHRAANLIDYVFRTLHTKQAKGSLGYFDTGFDMRAAAVVIKQSLHLNRR